jgi:hypothetical protein
VEVVYTPAPPYVRLKGEFEGRKKPAKVDKPPGVLNVPSASEQSPEQEAVFSAPARFKTYEVTIPKEFTEICPESACPLANIPETL